MRDSTAVISKCWAWVVGGVALSLVLVACGAEDPNSVASFRGYSLDAATLRSEFERVNAEIPWETTTVEQRADFADLLLKKEMLVRLADEACPVPDKKRARLDRILYEKDLVREFLVARRERFSMSAEEIEAEAAKLQRKARVHLATIRQDDIENVRAEMIAGGDYEQVARKYASDLGPQGRGFAETTIGLDNMPRPILRAVFLDDVPAGTVVGPVSSTRGIFFLRVIEYTPWDLTQISGAMDRASSVVEDVYYQPFNQAYVESLTAASGLEFHPDSYPLVLEIMKTFWDSVNVARMGGEPIEFQEFQAPVWLVPADQAAVPVLELFGKTYGVRDFVESLNDVDLDYWVTLGSLPKIQFQIESRAQRLLSVLQAEKTGVPERASFKAEMKRLREEHLLQQFRERYLWGKFVPDDAVLQAEFREHADVYTTTDQIAYGLIIFRHEQEAAARAFRETLRTSDPVRWFELATEAVAADSSVTYFPDSGLQSVQSAPPDPSWEPFRQAALELEPGEVSEVLRTQHGFSIVRSNQRQRPRQMTFEEARDPLIANARNVWLDTEIESRLGAAMESAGAKVDTAKLEADKMAEASGTNP